MANVIIVAVLAALAALALRSAVRHLRGKGGCCGGGGGQMLALEKSLDAPIVAEKNAAIGGMSCENCRAHVQNALNKIDGLAASVDLRTNTARLAMSRPVPDAEIRAAVEAAGYTVDSIA